MRQVILALYVSSLLSGVVGSVHAGPLNVLLLGDDQSESYVEAAFLAEGFNVTTVGVYYDWDGVSPDVDSFDVAVYLDGYDYGYGLQADAFAALSGFVADGGGLVTTEWLAWDVVADYGVENDEFLPVTAVDEDDYGYGAEWIVSDTGHALVSGLPGSWEDAAGWTTVNLKPGATSVIQSADGNPLLSYWNEPGGTVVHINNALTYDDETISDETLQILVNSARFADDPMGGGAGEPIPEPGTLVLVGLGAAAAGLAKRRRQKRAAA